MTFEGMGEMFEGDSADTCTGKFPLVLMGGRAEGLACADPGARTPIGASGNFRQFVDSSCLDLHFCQNCPQFWFTGLTFSHVCFC
jgi:hypothetical protein